MQDLMLAARHLAQIPPNNEVAMSLLRVLREVLTPGSAEFKAHLTRLSNREAELVKCLHSFEQPAIRDVRDATDEAAEF